jgi:hypothetical protein
LSAAPAVGARPAPPVRAVATVLAAVALLTVAGAVLGLRAVSTHDPAVDGRAPFAGAWNAAASFGPVRFEEVKRIAAAEFAGGHHTAQETVDELRVTVRAENRLDRRIPYSPGQFRVRVGATTITSVRPNPPPDSIAAGDAVSQRLTFVVPARRAAFTLVFDDLGRRTPLSIALGSMPSARKE